VFIASKAHDHGSGRRGRAVRFRERAGPATLLAIAHTRLDLFSTEIEEQREWLRPLAVMDQGLVAVRYIRNHAALLVEGVAFVAPLHPLRMARWLPRGWLGWRMAVAVKRILPG
jgi:YqjK-like protein